MLQPNQFERIATHVKTAIENHPVASVEEIVKEAIKVNNYIEPWELSLKDEIDLDPLLPSYSELQDSSFLELFITHYAGIIDA